ncbi:MAG: M20 family metallopeptidase [Promethearchaeota archaeon]
MNEQKILNEIENNKEEYINFLRELIQTDSYNPPGNEKNLAVKIEKYLLEVGIKSKIYTFGENRANLIAYLNDNKNGKNLLYNAHMDVVPPGSIEEWKNHPLSAYIKRKKVIFGRGAADMKGGLAAMVIALKILKKLDFQTQGNLIFNAVSDEETGGQLGTKWCVENYLKSFKCDFAIIGEPSGLNPLPKAIIIGEKGHLQLKIVTNGISCHASMPDMGKNPIYMMCEIIQNLNKLENYIPKIKPPLSIEELKNLIANSFPNKEIFERIYNEQKLLQNVVKSVTEFTHAFTIIKAKIKENVVPDKCEGIIDFRLLPGQSSEVIVNGLKRIINELGYKVIDTLDNQPEDIFVYIDIHHQSEASIWKNWSQSKELIQLYKLIENVYQKRPFYFLFPACADAHFLRNSDYCPQTVLFGPGSAGTAHATDEYIEIQDYLNSIKVYALFAYKFLKKK